MREEEGVRGGLRPVGVGGHREARGGDAEEVSGLAPLTLRGLSKPLPLSGPQFSHLHKREARRFLA